MTTELDHDFTYLSNANSAFVEDLYTKYKEDPKKVDPLWQKFFEGYEFSSFEVDSDNGNAKTSKESAVTKLIHAYRSRGHLIADTNPIRERRHHKSDLKLDYFGLSESDLNKEFDAGTDVKIGKATLKNILENLQKTYCEKIGIEFMYCRDEKIRQWLYDEMESITNKPKYSKEEKHHILKKIIEAITFENFLQTKYIGKKR